MQSDAEICLLVLWIEYFSFPPQPTPKIFKIMRHHATPGEYKWNNVRTILLLYMLYGYNIPSKSGSTWGAIANPLRLQRFAIQQQSTAPQSGHALLTQVRSMCSWTLPCALSLVPSVLHLSHGFQCSPTLNRQPYERRLPLTSWWRKSSNMTVGQSSLISLAHHCYDWHPGSRCGWTCNQLTSKVDGGITGGRLR